VINIKVNNLWGIVLQKSNLGIYIYYFQGKANLSYQASKETLHLAEQSGDTYSKAVAHTSHGFSCYCKGFLDKAESHLQKGANYCEKAKQYFWYGLANWCLGNTYFSLGEYQKSQLCYKKTIMLLEDGNFLPSFINLNKIALLMVNLITNKENINLEPLYAYYKTNKLKFFKGLMARYISEIVTNMNNQHLTDAESWINEAIEADKRNGLMFHLGQDYITCAKLLKHKGQKVKAKENKDKAIKILKECGADGWVEKYKKEMAEL
jgi:tetratricopeptide (TPR) repeat protein